MPNPQDVLYRKMAGRGGWAHLDLADALKVMEKEKTFHIATIKWLIVLIPVLMHLSMLTPRGGSGKGWGFDQSGGPMGRDLD